MTPPRQRKRLRSHRLSAAPVLLLVLALPGCAALKQLNRQEQAPPGASLGGPPTEVMGASIQPVQSWPYEHTAPAVTGRPFRREQVVTFAPGSASLDTEGTGALNLIVPGLRRNTLFTILVMGFDETRDESGAAERLAADRAETVRNFLVGRGIPADRIRTQAVGSLYAGGDEWTREQREQDRRAEVWTFRPE